MNMFYTGLGIARTLRNRGIPVIGLTAHKGIYGNFTRSASLRWFPDSRADPNAAVEYLVRLATEFDSRPILFPTRDDDLILLDGQRSRLAPLFRVVAPPSAALHACLDKWQTCQKAREADIPTPRSWLVANARELRDTMPEMVFPCVVKPLSSCVWRRQSNWVKVGGRKAVVLTDSDNLLREYELLAKADPAVLIQEMIPGGDDQLFIAACYLDKDANPVAGFAAQKLLQYPRDCGTGCIVRTVECDGLLAAAYRLLRAMRFSGIAEVEFKWDSRSREFKLIEVNARPWDQHILGPACGVDLILAAYCEQAELPFPPFRPTAPGHKWIAEDAFLASALRLLRAGELSIRELARLTQGPKVYAIWSVKDSLPFLAYMLWFVPQLLWTSIRHLASAPFRRWRRRVSSEHQLNAHHHFSDVGARR
jgi:predicted ATP-grasp superfamily ATP-dependent carboligase